MINSITGKEYTYEEFIADARIFQQPDLDEHTEPLGVDLVIEPLQPIEHSYIDHKELYDFLH